MAIGPVDAREGRDVAFLPDCVHDVEGVAVTAVGAGATAVLPALVQDTVCIGGKDVVPGTGAGEAEGRQGHPLAKALCLQDIVQIHPVDGRKESTQTVARYRYVDTLFRVPHLLENPVPQALPPRPRAGLFRAR